jgi:hypothetical protein
MFMYMMPQSKLQIISATAGFTTYSALADSTNWTTPMLNPGNANADDNIYVDTRPAFTFSPSPRSQTHRSQLWLGTLPLFAVPVKADLFCRSFKAFIANDSNTLNIGMVVNGTLTSSSNVGTSPGTEAQRDALINYPGGTTRADVLSATSGMDVWYSHPGGSTGGSTATGFIDQTYMSVTYDLIS